MGRSFYAFYDLVQANQERMICTAPSPKCLVCDCLKYQGADTIDLNTPWLCVNCKTILQKIVKEKENV